MPFRFLFDEHVSQPACHVLRERGVDVLHVLDVGLGRAPDSDVLAWAAAEGRIVVTRNYRDFATLHVRAIEAWMAIQAAADPEGVDMGRSPITNSFAWVTAA